MEFGLIWIACGAIAAVVAKSKGRSGCGWFAIGTVLGPLGFILALVVSKDQAAVDGQAVAAGDVKKCPYCAELVKAEAIKCRYCGEDI